MDDYLLTQPLEGGQPDSLVVESLRHLRLGVPKQHGTCISPTDHLTRISFCVPTAWPTTSLAK